MSDPVIQLALLVFFFILLVQEWRFLVFLPQTHRAEALWYREGAGCWQRHGPTYRNIGAM